MNCLNSLRDALLRVTPHVYHFTANKAKVPYVVWAESGEKTLWADDAPGIQVPQGTVDYFTRKENDPAVEQIQGALSGVCSWRLEAVQYEDDTGCIHWTWGWEIA